MLILSILVLLAWFYLWLFHGRFWEARIPEPAPEPTNWPSVVAVVPARDEAETIQKVVRSILGQDYPGRLSLIVVDDNSNDDTAQLAFMGAQQISKADGITVLKGQPLPDGWAGKVWAMHQGWEEAGKTAPDCVWFTDADIWHEPHALRRLAARAVHEDRALTSAMVELRCEGFWEKALVPAFVYFFKLLYPFRWVNDPQKKTAGAAGGSMLARSDILAKINGPSAIKGQLIDDCALARAIQNAGGKLRLDLTRDSRSLRGYPTVADAWNTIARTAYTQLGYSPWKLAGSVIGLGILFLLPIVAIAWILITAITYQLWEVSFPLFGDFTANVFLWFSWLLMTFMFQRIIRFYSLGTDWAFALPFITCFYLGATVDSARRYYAGTGGRWKGRSVER